MKRFDSELAAAKREKHMVAISRAEIDPHKSQAFVLDYSGRLVLLYLIFDFTPNGFAVIRREDITAVERRATDDFQLDLLREDGMFDLIDFSVQFDIKDISSFFRTFSNQEVIIVEDERDSTFLMGCIDDLDCNRLKMRCFTGAARWEDAPSIIQLANVTCCQLRSRYIMPYMRHFLRSGELEQTGANKTRMAKPLPL